MAQYFRKHGDRIECQLCPHFCKIAPGRTGICGVRKNTGSEIELITYGIVSGYSLDPVEKKPLYHYFPGSNILSVGSYGCNMRCDFCQNYNISQTVPGDKSRNFSISELVSSALTAEKNIGLAFTYNEPSISFEFIRDVAISAKAAGLKTVLVSNGYVNSEPLAEIIGFTDAFNIDLKAFNNTSYRKLTGADLMPVMKSLKQIAAAGRHLEITSLIIPGHNDSKEEMIKQTEWIAAETGSKTPLHLSRYYPMYKRNDPATSQRTLDILYNIASERLDHVYVGNIHSDNGQNTKCPGCGQTVTFRSGYNVHNTNLDNEGRCTSCGTLVYSNFIFSLLKDH